VLVSIPPNTIAKTAAGYGMFWFVVANGAKIAGGMAGAWIKALRQLKRLESGLP